MTSNSAMKEKPLQTTSPHPSRTSSTRLVVEIPSRKVLTAPYTLNKISNKPTCASSPFGYLSASLSACTPVADFNSNDEDFGTPFEHELEDGQASVTQGDDGLNATGDSFLDSINASSVPAYHGPKSCNTNMRNQHEVSPLVSWTSNPLCIIITLFPIMATPPFTVPILIPLTHPFWISQMGPMMTFLLSNGDSDNAVPLKVRGNAKPHSKAVVSPQPVSHLSEEPSLDEDDEDLKGGPFTTPEVEKIKAEYAVFDNVNSIQKIAILPTLTIRPAYDELVKKYGGEKSEDWAAESARLAAGGGLRGLRVTRASAREIGLYASPVRVGPPMLSQRGGSGLLGLCRENEAPATEGGPGGPIQTLARLGRGDLHIARRADSLSCQGPGLGKAEGGG
ncbi:hypothetical protein BS47DRAFT_1368267 [Hydnum rufescens UP504]|uniref:Uncharacterized protein n=1 Tax=Hydnum rufescens UP504 TaxID=1448309 RepID=A0A9P6AGA7_9AGAM|nr:hypothetical protein BS47DRAFT_1368267 [Hydnum rufescens UP504]